MRNIASLLALALIVAACTDTSVSTTTAEPGAPETTVAATTTVATTGPATDTSSTADVPPFLAVEEHIEWFVGLINGQPFAESDYATRFAQVFRDEVAAGEFTEIVDQIEASAQGWEVAEVEQIEPTAAIVRIAPAAGEPSIRLSLAVDPEGRIDSMFVQPAEPPRLEDAPATIDEAAAKLAEMGNLGFAVADIADDECVVRTGIGPDASVPLGSMFKLYVLGAVVDAVAAGSITWDQAVEIVDEHRSLPSGIVQDDPPGSTRTVRDLSELMISISDNTATDHLMALVGRDTVEEAQEAYGHSAPVMNRPFLSTRDLFVLKLADRPDEPGVPGPLGAAYIEADEAGRRVILDEEVPHHPVDTLDPTGFDTPIAVEELEWFASPLDLCRALVRLHRDPEAARILSLNPGVPDESGLWESIGFKGGSEPGVLGMAWHLTAGDGAASVVAGTVWNPGETLDETEAALLFGAIRDLSG